MWDLFPFRNMGTQLFISPLGRLLSEGSLTTHEMPLARVVGTALSGSNGTYGIFVKHLKTGETYGFNENRAYESGSLYKLWVMATVFQEIQNGKLQEKDTIQADVSVLNDAFNIASDTAELTEGTVSFSVKSALEKMITISHNYAALLLTKKVRLATVASFLDKYGITESKVGIDGSVPRTTPHDIALFFEKLYKGELANPDNTKKMLELLKQQKLNNKLPKHLPDDVVIAHKTGEIGYFTHDGGIVYGENGDYIIIILSESNYPPGAEERIAQVSLAIYNYYEGK